MIGIFEEMQKEHLVERVFYTGEIKTQDQFIAAMKRNSNVVHSVWDQDEKKSLMIAWLNNWQKHAAFAHFCIFRVGWGANSVPLGRMSLEHWFSFKDADGNQLLDVICGKTPENNKLATRYLKRVGMKIVGTIPYLDYDHYRSQKIGAVFSYITKEDFQNG
jgi:hypothetical protein